MYAVVSRTNDPTPRLEKTTPAPLGPEDVRVQVAAAAFTLFDAYSAAHHETLGLPELVGHGFDFSGAVLKTGAEVHGVATGDLVAGVHADPAAPARAHATEVVVPARDIAPVPAGLSPESAAAVPLNALTARQALDLLGPERGRLLVTGGAGSVGGWAIVLAKSEGWTADALVRPGAEPLAREAGPAEVVTELPAGAYDAVIDTAAIGPAALAAVTDKGRYVSVKPGRAPAAERGITIATVLTRPDGATLADLLTLAAKGAAPVRIAATRPLATAAETYTEATNAPGSTGRWLLVP